jgi:putative ferrous iron transport protein C
MIVSELHRYLAERRRAPLAEVAHRFEVDVDALRGMLALLERKGRVRRLTPGACKSSGCTKCDPAAMEVYEIVD